MLFRSATLLFALLASADGSELRGLAVLTEERDLLATCSDCSEEKPCLYAGQCIARQQGGCTPGTTDCDPKSCCEKGFPCARNTANHRRWRYDTCGQFLPGTTKCPKGMTKEEDAPYCPPPPCFNSEKWGKLDKGCTEKKKICVKADGTEPELGDPGTKCVKCINNKEGEEKDRGCNLNQPICMTDSGEPDSGKAGGFCVESEDPGVEVTQCGTYIRNPVVSSCPDNYGPLSPIEAEKAYLSSDLDCAGPHLLPFIALCGVSFDGKGNTLTNAGVALFDGSTLQDILVSDIRNDYPGVYTRRFSSDESSTSTIQGVNITNCDVGLALTTNTILINVVSENNKYAGLYAHHYLHNPNGPTNITVVEPVRVCGNTNNDIVAIFDDPSTSNFIGGQFICDTTTGSNIPLCIPCGE